MRVRDGDERVQIVAVQQQAVRKPLPRDRLLDHGDRRSAGERGGPGRDGGHR